MTAKTILARFSLLGSFAFAGTGMALVSPGGVEGHGGDLGQSECMSQLSYHASPPVV
jgi:hypothetical protein